MSRISLSPKEVATLGAREINFDDPVMSIDYHNRSNRNISHFKSNEFQSFFHLSSRWGTGWKKRKLYVSMNGIEILKKSKTKTKPNAQDIFIPLSDVNVFSLDKKASAKLVSSIPAKVHTVYILNLSKDICLAGKKNENSTFTVAFGSDREATNACELINSFILHDCLQRDQIPYSSTLEKLLDNGAILNYEIPSCNTMPYCPLVQSVLRQDEATFAFFASQPNVIYGLLLDHDLYQQNKINAFHVCSLFIKYKIDLGTISCDENKFTFLQFLIIEFLDVLKESSCNEKDEYFNMITLCAENYPKHNKLSKGNNPLLLALRNGQNLSHHPYFIKLIQLLLLDNKHIGDINKYDSYIYSIERHTLGIVKLYFKNNDINISLITKDIIMKCCLLQKFDICLYLFDIAFRSFSRSEVEILMKEINETVEPTILSIGAVFGHEYFCEKVISFGCDNVHFKLGILNRIGSLKSNEQTLLHYFIQKGMTSLSLKLLDKGVLSKVFELETTSSCFMKAIDCNELSVAERIIELYSSDMVWDNVSKHCLILLDKGLFPLAMSLLKKISIAEQFCFKVAELTTSTKGNDFLAGILSYTLGRMSQEAIRFTSHSRKKLILNCFTANYPECLKSLISNDFKFLDQTLDTHEKPIHLAINKRDLTFMNLFIKFLANPNSLNADKKTPLHLCVEAYDDNNIFGKQALEALLTVKVDPYILDDEGYSPIHRAAIFGNTFALKLFNARFGSHVLWARQTINQEDSWFLALKNNHIRVVNLILQQSDDILRPQTGSRRTFIEIVNEHISTLSPTELSVTDYQRFFQVIACSVERYGSIYENQHINELEEVRKHTKKYSDYSELKKFEVSQEIEEKCSEDNTMSPLL